ncbi:Oxidoreductase-like domain-containing protein 1 [Toxocara canis]|uniref:Oxidoreductase-like domain-containing protein 1 n=1 Tax=Toxocara canis TaxID=6265 RepID=A0A0B2V5I9_TOXCA|nr:Oxidoreductase-like domain-containing protein 1 [Toxocara canis]
MMRRSVGRVVDGLVTRRNVHRVTANSRLFTSGVADTTLDREGICSVSSTVQVKNARSPPPPPPEPKFSCVSTRTVTPRRAYVGSHAPEPPDPLTCCGSGCADCVWIVYGTELMHYYSDKPIEEALRMIDEQIADVCMREYVKSEVRAKARHRMPF